jgi:hypothetical protein
MVDEGFLTEDQLLDALAEQNRSGTPLGKVLVDLGFVSPGAVANALAEQHGGLLRTEYGTSAGLREMAGRAPIRTEAPQPTLPMPAAAAPQAQPPAPAPAPLGSGLRLAGPATDAPPEEAPAPAPAEATPAPVAPQPAPVAAQAPEPVQAPTPEPAVEPAPAPQPDPAAEARIQELESKLHAVLTERNSLAQSFNELQARLSDAAQAHEAGVNAEVQERVGALESQLQAAAVNRDELERAQQQAVARIAELEGRLAETAEGRKELDDELERLRLDAAGRDEALARVTALEVELEEARAGRSEDSSAELHELAEQRRAAEERAEALEGDLARLREQHETALQSAAAEKDSESARAAQLEAELAALREQSAGQDDVVAQVSGLNEALQALTVERDAALARSAALEPEVESLRAELRDAIAQIPGDGPQADVSELRRQLAARERRLAESVGEIAKMNREHRALLQLVERQFQLEDTTTSMPDSKGEAAHVLFVPSTTGYTLLERDGAAPEAGDTVEVDGGRYVVRRHGPSPLPGPRRRCAYLERA